MTDFGPDPSYSVVSAQIFILHGGAQRPWQLLAGRSSVQRVGELAPTGDDLWVGRVEEVEQLDQPGAD